MLTFINFPRLSDKSLSKEGTSLTQLTWPPLARTFLSLVALTAETCGTDKGLLAEDLNVRVGAYRSKRSEIKLGQRPWRALKVIRYAFLTQIHFGFY